MIRLGVDVGGTFTDLVVVDDADGEIRLGKVPSTPAAPDRAVLAGLDEVAVQLAIDPATIDQFIHGTTVATNALIERKGVDTAVVVTAGFRDVLHIARQTRPRLYDFFARRPDPFVPRHLRYEVPERMLHTGAVKTPLDEGALRAVAAEIAARGIKVVAVCFLHSYSNPAHEKRAEEILGEEIPDVVVCTSHSVLPEFKEYERSSTTVINAYVMPIVEAYLERIAAGIAVRGVRSGLHVMQSNGGLMTAATAGRQSVRTVLSGPAAGVLGAVVLGERIDAPNLITVDMGGTSFDVSLTYRGAPNFASESEIDGHVIKVPMLDIKTLGAGGGSIAWVDAGGALQVGPQSAGADPGPACYGRGGQEATVTDANLVLGYLNPHTFAGGVAVDIERARRAIDERVARPMGLDIERAAAGIVAVVNATMIRGIRLVSVERGYDPRDFALMCFGGAGPVHAVQLARELDIPEVIVPEAPGVNCALGLLMADFRHDYSQTLLAKLGELEPGRLNDGFVRLEAAATTQMLGEGLQPADIALQRGGDLRYAGQGYELQLPLPAGDFCAQGLARLAAEFSKAHEDLYGYRMADAAVEIVNLRLTAVGLTARPKLREEIPAGADAAAAQRGIRRMYMEGQYREVAVYDRTRLRCGNRLISPAVVEQADSTTVVFPGYRAEVDRCRNLIIARAE